MVNATSIKMVSVKEEKIIPCDAAVGILLFSIASIGHSHIRKQRWYRAGGEENFASTRKIRLYPDGHEVACNGYEEDLQTTVHSPVEGCEGEGTSSQSHRLKARGVVPKEE